ncbi:MAG: hypothetical protein U9Q71_07890 [Pseudomonadota bacterium]|nr:hypothetical protein [Pseudomonadota bacterium]
MKIQVTVAVLLLLAGCASTGISGRPNVREGESLQKPATEIAENELLDVWIEVFEPGLLPEKEKKAVGLSMDIREAESRYLPVHLRDVMEKTGYWGAVRVVPRDTEGAELLIKGEILNSDGERLQLRITAEDATGRRWFEKSYLAESKIDNYQNTQYATVNLGAFEHLYHAIANDLARFRSRLTPEEILAVRRVAEMRFAADFAPDPFRDYLRRNGDGGYDVVRLPATDDPMQQRVTNIRERDYMLIDTLNGHFDNFYLQMEQPYNEWRKARTIEAEAMRRIQRQANTRKILGVAAILGGIAMATQTSGNSGSAQASRAARDVMIIGGMYAVKQGYDIGAQAAIHREAIEELGDSFSAEAQPLVVEVDGEVHRLTGSAEEQYQKWRELLQRIYASETGFTDLSPQET